MTGLVGANLATWSAAGCHVTCLPTGAEGLHELLNHQYAVALVSATLPDLSPTVFLEELTRLAPSTVVATTAPVPASPSSAASQPLPLPTPLNAATLRSAVTRLIRGSPPGGPDRFSDIVRSLNQIEDGIIDATRMQDALGRVCLELAELAGCDAIALYLPDAEETCLLRASRRTLTPEHVQALLRAVETQYSRFTRQPVQFAEPPQVVETERGAPPPPFVEIVGVPLLAEHQIKGVLCAAFSSAAAHARCQTSILFHLANHAVLIHQEVWRARNLAARDLLTGLYNRRTFTDSLRQMFSLAQRKQMPIGLVLFDFDNFKSINDQHGHLIGDKVLREAAGLTLATARTSDTVARWGGDEFAILLPEATLSEANQAAERLRAAFRDRQFGTPNHRLNVMLSIGVAALVPSKETNSQTLVALADEGLLAAKRSGKDRICVAATADGAARHAPETTAAPLPTSSDPTAVRGRVLVLDDDPAVLQVLSSMLRLMQFEPTACVSLKDALLAIETETNDYDLVLTDLHFSSGTGVDLLQALKDKAPWTVKMVVSAYASKETAIECLRHGAFDFIEKPFSYTQLAAALDRAMEHRRLLVVNQRYQNQLEGLVRSRSESLANALETLRRSYSQTIQTMALMIDARDGDTGTHCRAAREAVRLLARQMNISHHDLETMEMGAVLHDIGKLGLPDAILQKPGTLTPDDQRVMRTHPKIGYDLLIGVPFLHDVAEIVLQHHETYDGSGYPAGLRGEQICIGARIFAIIDAYHAMRSARCYRQPLSREDSYNEIVRCSGRQFDPAAVAAFLNCHEEIEAAFAAKPNAA